MHCDIIIIGAGPAGSVTAKMLAPTQRVVVLERRATDVRRIGETLPPEAHPVLRRIGLLDAFLADGHAPSHGNASIWGGSERIDRDFIFNPYGNGWHLDRHRFDQLLRTEATRAGAEVRRSCLVNRVEPSGELQWPWPVAVTDVRGVTTLACRFLVDATGRSASIARRLFHAGQRVDDKFASRRRHSYSGRSLKGWLVGACSVQTLKAGT
jgi:flavin-dependent dehydrogenase